jgi:hypothetical protein
MFRHGDVLIAAADAIPATARQRQHCILARGEATGHSHRVEPGSAAVLYEDGDVMYLEVVAEGASVVHEEHAPIDLPRGTYRVWRQREYTPEEIRRVID